MNAISEQRGFPQFIPWYDIGEGAPSNMVTPDYHSRRGRRGGLHGIREPRGRVAAVAFGIFRSAEPPKGGTSVRAVVFARGRHGCARARTPKKPGMRSRAYRALACRRASASTLGLDNAAPGAAQAAAPANSAR